MNIERLFHEHRDYFNRDLEQNFEQRIGVGSGHFISMAQYVLLAGGKRLRPTLALLACRACGGDDKKMMPLACALEFIHVSTLVLDDLPSMDNASERWGHKTLHEVFGQSSAILVSLGLSSRAFELVAHMDVPASKRVALIQVLAHASGFNGVVGGQYWDLNAWQERGTPLNDKQRLDLIVKKTTPLFSAATLVGALYADASIEQQQSLEHYGQHFGYAFQVLDDLADIHDPSPNFATIYGRDDARKLIEEVSAQACKELEIFGSAGCNLRACAQWLVARAQGA